MKHIRFSRAFVAPALITTMIVFIGCPDDTTDTPGDTPGGGSTATYTCNNGTPVDSTPSGTSDVEECTACNTGFTLTEKKCVADTDSTAPTFTAGPTLDTSTDTTATVTLTASEVGKVFWLLYASTDSSPDSAAALIKDASDDSSTGVQRSGTNVTVDAATEKTVPLSGLTPGTTYTFYAVLQDAAKNTSDLSPRLEIPTADNVKYTCVNGTAKPGTPSGTSNVEECIACNAGFTLNAEKKCVASAATYICTNGTPVDGTADSAGIEKCASCNIGHIPSGNQCLRDTSTLTLETAATGDLTEGQLSYGTVYKGTYTALDGVATDAWISLRPTSSTTVGSIHRIAVAIQGGTGTSVTEVLNEDEGLHSVLISVNHRGANITTLAGGADECRTGPTFIDCLKSHPTFAKINPQRTAQDANAVVHKFLNNQEITVNGHATKAVDFISSVVGASVDVDRSAISLYTGSFGGVIVGYMLQESNAPPLHNVFLDQVTGLSEQPISDGFNTAERMLNTLYKACEEDANCNAAYPNLRTTFRTFLNAYHSTAITIDGEDIYAGGVFDRTIHILEEKKEVGRAIRYIGEIANAYRADTTATSIRTGNYAPTDYTSMIGERPRTTYGLPDLSGTEINALLQRAGLSFFPGITSRVAMICSWGINRINGDTTALYNARKSEPLTNDSGGTKEMIGYGFLISYKSLLSICPQLSAVGDRLSVPAPRNIKAANVIIYRGGLDVKHVYTPDPNMDEYYTIFSDATNKRVIDHTFLAQGRGEDFECKDNIRTSFWSAVDVDDAALGDTCEESNTKTASQLTGW